MNSVYVSTGGFGNKLVKSTVAAFNDVGICRIELSGGIVENDTLPYLKKLTNQNCKFILHNYFPAPSNESFVLNLGSSSYEIRNQSKKLINKALNWSSELGSNVYAIHAPFRLDPNTFELGRGFAVKLLSNLTETMEIFSNEYLHLRDRARNLGIDLLIENNVISKKDFINFGVEHPFLFTGEDQNILSNYLNEDFNVLMDFGHLKVSANSLGFNMLDTIKSIENKIKWFHLSENDGLSDLNLPFDGNAWFWDYLYKEKVPVTIEVYNKSPQQLRKLQKLVEKNFTNFDM